MREAEKKEEGKECEAGTKCAKERMKHVRGVYKQNKVSIMAEGHATRNLSAQIDEAFWRYRRPKHRGEETRCI